MHIFDNTLIIDIAVNTHQIWKYTISDLPTKLLANLTSEIVSDVVVEHYKKYIFERYFY